MAAKSPTKDADQPKLVDVPGLAMLHVSFGAMNVKVEKEPKLRDQVYMVIAGHVHTTGLSSGKPELNVTLVGEGTFISKQAYAAAMGADWEGPE